MTCLNIKPLENVTGLQKIVIHVSNFVAGNMLLKETSLSPYMHFSYVAVLLIILILLVSICKLIQSLTELHFKSKM